MLFTHTEIQNENDKALFGHHRLVAIVENFYDILEHVHSTENGHVGYLCKALFIHSYLCKLAEV